jgi:hypothetical protein
MNYKCATNRLLNSYRKKKHESKNNLIALFMICYNEEKIIDRFLEHILCIKELLCNFTVVTNSSDATIPKIQEWTAKHGISFSWKFKEFKNFAEQRKASFDFCREKCPQAQYYLTLDADHCLKLINMNSFLSELKSGDMLAMKEKLGSNEGYNYRIFSQRIILDCWVGTHECWESCTPNEIRKNIEYLYVEDKSDGGSHDVKFTRDIRILNEELVRIKYWEEHDMKDYDGSKVSKHKYDIYKHRVNFYLGQSYGCLDKYKLAAKYYLLRTLLGGFEEEVYISYWKAGYSYEKLAWLYRDICGKFDGGIVGRSQQKKLINNNISVDNLTLLQFYQKTHKYFCKAIQLYNQAQQVRPTRGEAQYQLVTLQRSLQNHHLAVLEAEKGREISKPSDLFQVNNDIYRHLFDMELLFTGVAKCSNPFFAEIAASAKRRLIKNNIIREIN